MKYLSNIIEKIKNIRFWKLSVPKTENSNEQLLPDYEKDTLSFSYFLYYSKFITTVIYIENSYHPQINDYIRSNIEEITIEYEKHGFYFVYLPLLLESDSYKNIWDYNHPYFNSNLVNITADDIYKEILLKYDISIDGAVLFSMKYEHPDYKIKYRNLFPELDISDQFQKNADDLYYLIHQVNFYIEESIVEDSSNRLKFRKISVKDTEADLKERAFEDKIRKNIEKLLEKGSLEFIGEIIEKLQNVTAKLSHLFITNDYRIFLKDFGMKEVLMAPLPKSLFVLYLRHPEGIAYKQLSDFHDELLSIYRDIATHENLDKVMDSITAMTDPLNNSVNEKASRIRAAFLEIITNDIAQYYYITGKKGEPKKIILDRSLVEYQ
jgi:hypothetical protein